MDDRIEFAEDLYPEDKKPKNLKKVKGEVNLITGLRLAKVVAENINKVASFSNKLNNFFPVLKAYFESQFEEFGISNINWHRTTIPVKYDNNSNQEVADIGAKSDVDFVSLPDVQICFPELKDFEQAKLAVHEFYHASSPFNMRLPFSDENESAILERTGLAYAARDPQSQSINMAIEEGMALKSEYDALELLKERFREGYKERVRAIKALKNAKLLPKEIDPNLVVITQLLDNKKGGYTVAFIQRDKAPYELVKYLNEQVVGFFSMVERARLKRQTLSLARSIEKIFGRGSYILIMETKEEDSKRLLLELKSRANSK